VVPHSATLFEDEAACRSSKVLEVLRSLRDRWTGETFDAVVVLSPFWISEKHFYIDPNPHHHASHDYAGYAVEVKYDCPGHPALARLLLDAGRTAGLPVSARRHGADHSASVPMHFLFPKRRMPLVPLSASELPLKMSLAWGRAIREALARSGLRILLLCGGGLSHNLTACLHWEDSIASLIYDQKVMACLRDGRGAEVPKMDLYWLHAGNPSSGLSDLFIFLGAIGEDSPGNLLAYDGAPGVGWAVMEIK